MKIKMKCLLPLLLLPCFAFGQAVTGGNEPLVITDITAGYEEGVFTDAWYDAPAGQEAEPSNKIYAFNDVDFYVEGAFATAITAGTAILPDKTEADSNTASLFSFTTNIETQICVWFDDDIDTKHAWVASFGLTDGLHNIEIAEKPHSGYCGIKAAGVQTLGGNTNDGATDVQMYAVSIHYPIFRVQDDPVPGPTDPGEYRFTGDFQVPESDTTNSADTIRENGSDGAVSIDITDLLTGTCSSGSDYTAISDTTKNWADTVTGNAGGVDIIAGNVSADCTIDFGFTAATGGILPGPTLQTQTTTIQNTVSPPAEATYYIDCDSGSDAANGTTTGTPWKTFANADQNGEVAPGDIIWIKGTCPATTGDKRVANLSASGTSGNPITYAGWDGESNQIGRLPPTLDDKYGFVTVGADYLVFENLNFAGFENKCIYVAGAPDGSTDITIRNNTFDQCGKAHTSCDQPWGHGAIDFGPYSNGSLVENNRITDPGRTVTPAICDPLGNTNNHQYRHDHAIYAKGKGHIIRNNVILGHDAGIGVKIDGYNTILGEVVAPNYSHIVINNTFGPNTSLQPYDGCSGHPVAPTNSTPDSYDPRYLVANNIMLEPINGLNGGFCSGAVLIQDVSWQNFPNAAFCHNNISSGTKVASTCSEHQGAISPNVTQSNNVINETLVNLDFVDEPNDDYDVNAGSSAKLAGDCTLDGAPTTDINGDARSATTCTVGAYE